MAKWRIEDSEELYNIGGWGVNYFGINRKGHVYVTPSKDGNEIDLKELVDDLVERDIKPPILLRFPEILDNRIEKSAECFEKAAKEYKYSGHHYIVFPVKVNQMRPVVEEIVSHGKRYNVGLEAGSKPELHAVLATNMGSDSLIICNGHKDRNFIRMALLAQKMGKRIFLVIEKIEELDTILQTARQLDMRPDIGIRIKLAAQGTGKWEESGGDASKFGLDSADLLVALDALERQGMADCLKLIHFHIGSQVTNIRRIQAALTEASQFYVQLHNLGFNIQFIDCGGGLGVDYDGTRSSNSESSVNYSIQEYINDCVYTFVETSNRNNIPHPNIVTESGRSLTAHHAILITEAFEKTSLPQMDESWEASPDDHKLVKDLSEIWDHLSNRSMLEDWHDAQQIREEGLDLFSHGLIDLKTRAQIEKVYWSITREVNAMAHTLKHIPEELLGLDKLLAEKYYTNFSLFQSMPDTWGIDQLFPALPIQRLNEKPTHNATLHDITCDSDGTITTYVNNGRLTRFMPLHDLKKDDPYYIGFFLVGAYQEILGNMHNLFGDTTTVHVISGQDGNYKISHIRDGETIADVLGYVQYDPKHLVRRLETWVARAVKQGRISVKEGKNFIENYRSGLYGYTYLE